MTLDLHDPDLAPLLARLQPYACGVLERAATHALRLHADTVTPEHLLSTLMEDERTAAHAAVLHAFADPATISAEALAISPGLMVVASGSTLPFSPAAASVLAKVRETADARDPSEVNLPDVLSHAAAALGSETWEIMLRGGFILDRAPVGGAAPVLGSALFKHFSAAAKRALSASNRLAAAEGAEAISPAHLLLACLREDEELARRVGMRFSRAQSLLAGRTRDETAPSPRLLPPDPTLIVFLSGLPRGSNSLALLARFLEGGTPELAQILLRSKVTSALLDRAREAFQDPESFQDEGPSRRSGRVEL